MAGKAAKERKRREFLRTMAAVRVEKIVIVGAPGSWIGKRVVRVLEEGVGEREVEIRFHKGNGVKSSWAVVRDPGVGIGRGWSVEF